MKASCNKTIFQQKYILLLHYQSNYFPKKRYKDSNFTSISKIKRQEVKRYLVVHNNRKDMSYMSSI